MQGLGMEKFDYKEEYCLCCFCLQAILPPLFIAIAMLITLTQDVQLSEKPLSMSPSLYPGPNYLPLQALKSQTPLGEAQLATLDTPCGVGASHIGLHDKERAKMCGSTGATQSRCGCLLSILIEEFT